MRYRSAIVMSWGLLWMLLTGCTETSPYLRDLQPSYNQDGTLDRESYRINRAWMRHMLKDLQACYKEAD
jgi:hypothetical protein